MWANVCLPHQQKPSKFHVKPVEGPFWDSWYQSPSCNHPLWSNSFVPLKRIKGSTAKPMKCAFYRLALSWADRCIRNNLYKCGHNIKDEQHVYCMCIYISCICKNEHTKFVCTKSSGGGFLSNLNITLPRTFSISIYPIEGPPSLCSGNRRRWKEIREFPFFQALELDKFAQKRWRVIPRGGIKKNDPTLHEILVG